MGSPPEKSSKIHQLLRFASGYIGGIVFICALLTLIGVVRTQDVFTSVAAQSFLPRSESFAETRVSNQTSAGNTARVLDRKSGEGWQQLQLVNANIEERAKESAELDSKLRELTQQTSNSNLEEIATLAKATYDLRQRKELPDQSEQMGTKQATSAASAQRSPTTSLQDSGSLESSVECVFPYYNRSCTFRNLYFLRNPNTNFPEFTLLLLHSSSEKYPDSDITIRLTDKYWGPWKPSKRFFETQEQIAAFVSSQEFERYSGLSLLFQPIFHRNIGHALFDSLYSAFFALVKFGRHDEKFRPIAAVDEDCYEEPHSDIEEGIEVKTYVPDYQRLGNRSLHPVRARVIKLSDAKSSEEQCEIKVGEDHRGTDVGRVALQASHKAHLMEEACCDACRKSLGCKAGVVHRQICYLKGQCIDPTNGCTYKRDEGQTTVSIRKHNITATSLIILQKADGKRVRVPPEWIVRPVRKRCRSEDIMEKFAGLPMMRVWEMEYDVHQDHRLLARFDEVVAGSGNIGNMVMEKSIAMAGTLSPYYGTALMRDRMMKSYGVSPRYQGGGLGRGGTGMHRPLPDGEQIQAIIIDNKRFSANDRQVLHDAISRWNDESKGLVNARYVIWPNEGDFANHMQVVGDAHIYISSPGTALQYVPFMWDGGVFVALGAPMKRYGRAIPSFVEQQLAGGGTPYLRTIYMDSADMMRPSNGAGDFLTFSVVMDLFHKAQELVTAGVTVPTSVSANICVEGRLMLEYCELDPGTCNDIYQQQNGYGNPKYFDQCVGDNWLEIVVYELGGYAEAGYNGQRCTLNRELLRKLRKKYKLGDYDIPM